MVAVALVVVALIIVAFVLVVTIALVVAIALIVTIALVAKSLVACVLVIERLEASGLVSVVIVGV